MSQIIHNPAFWVAASFVCLLLIAVYFKAHHQLFATLDSRSAKIKAELDAAKALRAEAEALLADYKLKQAEQQHEAEAMLQLAGIEAETLRQDAQKKLEQSLAAKMDAAIKRIELQEKQALEEVRNQVIDKTIEAAKKKIAAHYDAMSSADMTKHVLKDLDRQVH